MHQVPATRYQQLLTQIETTYQQGRREAVQAVNQQLVRTYWQLGQQIESPSDLLREPYIFEFLKIPEPEVATLAQAHDIQRRVGS